MVSKREAMHSRGRLDALGDGIFGVAMTLLVLDLRLPEDFHPQTSSELVHGLAELSPKFFPYALSFYVLGLRWQWKRRSASTASGACMGAATSNYGCCCSFS